MPVVCRFKPVRSGPRRFTEVDAARIMCKVVRGGGSRARIEAEFRRRCVDAPQRRSSEAQQALELSAQVIQENTVELDATFRYFQVVNGLLAALALIGLVLPILRPVRIAAQLARVATTARLTSNRAQAAANERTFGIVQRAAENEARFLRQANE